MSADSGTLVIGGRNFSWGEKTYVMGILNVTPDSFSGDGIPYDVDGAVRLALEYEHAGADIIDVGGESTRPPGVIYGAGAEPVPSQEEWKRVIPVIRELHKALSIPISIDTYKADIAEAAVAAGAAMINDVWGLQGDPRMVEVAASANIPIVLTHNRESFGYKNLLQEVTSDLVDTIECATMQGVAGKNIIVDPGIGFGKSPQQNLELIRRLAEFKVNLGKPVLLGVSRKSTVGIVLGGLSPGDRLHGTSAAVALSIGGGADIVRVHDVREMIQISVVSDAIVRGWRPSE